jgi:O-antigen biosynthesis protein
MASPHPSYPPLEMATMGLAVITNRFGSKDLSLNHPGIRSIAAPCPRMLAEELARTLVDVRQGIRAQGGEPARLPSNMSPRSWADNLRRLNIQRLAAPE